MKRASWWRRLLMRLIVGDGNVIWSRCTTDWNKLARMLRDDPHYLDEERGMYLVAPSDEQTDTAKEKEK